MGVGILPLLLSLIFPACGQAGAAGVKSPGLVDFSHLVLPRSPNKALAAPAGFTPKPDFDTPRYNESPEALFATVEKLAGSEPRTYVLDKFPGHLQQAWVERTPLANFPDIVIAQVTADPDGGSSLILYSHSIYGYSDFGANAERIKRWLGQIGKQAAERGS